MLPDQTVVGYESHGVLVSPFENPEIRNIAVRRCKGSGIYCGESCTPSIIDCLIEENESSGGGGLLCQSGAAPRIRGCTLRSNFGGGVYSWEGSPTIEDSTIVGNRADFGGGGVFAAMSKLTMKNCVVLYNSAGHWGGGIEVAANKASSTLLVHCTIAGNVAEEGGGIYCQGEPQPVLRNCIFWANDPPEPCGDIGFCMTGQDPLFVDPGAADLARFRTVPALPDGTMLNLPDFIDRMPDCHLAQGSPAIGGASAELSLAFDLEGNPRPCGAAPDLGAYESCSPPPVWFVRGDVNKDGRVDISDTIAVLLHLFAHRPASCMDALDTNDSGTIDIADAIAILGHLFAHAGPLPAPFATCGIDSTADDLGCSDHSPCE